MTGDYPAALEEVIALLKRFPGVGRRSAERMALAMLKWETDQIRALGEAVRDIPERIGRCPDCGGVAAVAVALPVVVPGDDNPLDMAAIRQPVVREHGEPRLGDGHKPFVEADV